MPLLRLRLTRLLRTPSEVAQGLLSVIGRGTVPVWGSGRRSAVDHGLYWAWLVDAQCRHGVASLRPQSRHRVWFGSEGRRVTGFTNSEEQASGLTDIVPFLVEDELKAKGGTFEKTADWGVLTVTDGLLTTGQNPASSSAAAARLLEGVAH
jgi:hypothetical protein